MKNYIFNILLFFYFINFIIFIISCSTPTEPQLINEFWGQIKSDINTAVLKSDSTVWTCGPNITGQLGIGSLEPIPKLVQVTRLKGIVSIDLYGGMAVAADQEGYIWFWGENLYRPTYPSIQVVSPTKISYLKGTKFINICGDFIHILKKDGTIWRLSINYNSPTEFISPKKLPELKGIYSISQTLALRYDGTIHEIIHTEPERGELIPDIRGVVALQNVWNRRTLILKKDGSVWAWGKNAIGQLGNGTCEDSAVPVKVKNLTDIIKISANLNYNLALKRNGTAWYWGFEKIINEHIHIGINNPIKIKNLENVALINAENPCHFIKKDGSVWYFWQSKREIGQLFFE